MKPFQDEISEFFIAAVAIFGSIGLAAALLFIVLAAVFACPLSWAWNELAPLVPHLPVIGWTHAFAFYVLIACAKLAFTGIKVSAKSTQDS